MQVCVQGLCELERRRLDSFREEVAEASSNLSLYQDTAVSLPYTKKDQTGLDCSSGW